MDLRWLLYSACTHVLGYPKDARVHCTNEAVVKKTLNFSDGEKFKGTCKDMYPTGFQMPLHYPRYTKANYDKMEEWKLDVLLKEYGLNFKGTLEEKRAYAIGTFLWPDQL